MSNTPQTLSQRVADFVASRTWDSVPAAVRERAALVMHDAIVRLSWFAADFTNEIVEMDINPLPLGEGRVGVHCLKWRCVMGSRLRGNDGKRSFFAKG